MNPNRITRDKNCISKRDLLMLRYDGKCVLCGKRLQNRKPSRREDYMTIDHIIPKSKGGTNNIENLRPLCRKCNMERGNKDIKGLQYYKTKNNLYITF